MGTDKHVIIGWGLAGAVLSWNLFFEDKNFEIYDSGENHSTRTAAGLVNPVVFRRLTKSWKADELLPAAAEFYKRVEKVLGTKLLSDKSIYRVFSSIEEQNNWSSKLGDDRFAPYLEFPDKKEWPANDQVDYPFGLGKVKTIGNLDTNLFLDASKAFFESKGVLFINQRFDYETPLTDATYLFCEGTGLTQNPYFNHLPIRQTHGETLTVKAKGYDFEQILNKNMFILGLGNDTYRVGATYNWNLKEPVTTPEAREELQEKMAAFLKFDYEVIAQKAGVRPTVIDRRPMLGRHPEHNNAVVFNGLGTKGVMIAPYFATHLLTHLWTGAPLDTEVDIKRFE